MQGETHFVLNPSLIGVMLGDSLDDGEDQAVPSIVAPTGIQVYKVTHECPIIRMTEKGFKTGYPEVTAEYHLS